MGHGVSHPHKFVEFGNYTLAQNPIEKCDQLIAYAFQLLNNGLHHYQKGGIGHGLYFA
jgi:hypothetical protein